MENKIKTLEAAISTTSELLSWMGPEPDMTPPDVFLSRWENAMSIGSFTQVRHAANDFLAGGQVTPERQIDLRNALFSWYTDGDALEKQHELLREAHAQVFRRLVANFPIYHLSSAANVMADHSKSRFPHNDELMLADPMVENLFGVCLIRLEFVKRSAARFRDEQASVEDLIKPQLQNYAKKMPGPGQAG